MENETIMETMEQPADQQDAFLAGWDDDYATDGSDQSAEPEAQETVQEEPTETAPATEAATETATENAEETTSAAPAAETEQPTQTETPTTWSIKHMGAEKTLGVGDITTDLLQKGMDYDRIRTKYDEAKPVIEMFAELAKKANVPMQDYVKSVRAQAKTANGMSEDEANRAVELEDREAAVSAREAEQTQAQEAESASRTGLEKDLADFKTAFPDAYQKAKDDPKAIPPSVWDEVNRGFTLTSAYARYMVAQAQEAAKAAAVQAAAAQQTQKNTARSTGSMKSAGNDTKAKDAFLDAWGD